MHDDALDTLRELDALTQTEQRWVWDVATILHETGLYDTAACFHEALNARDWTGRERCEACDLFAIYPSDHAFDCPLAEFEEPAYAAHCILTEVADEADTDGYSEATSPAGWSHP